MSSRHARRKFRQRMERMLRTTNEVGRFTVRTRSFDEAMADVPHNGNPVPYEARLLVGGHTSPTFAVTGKIVDGQVKPLGRHKPTKRPKADDLGKYGPTSNRMLEHGSLNVGSLTVGRGQKKGHPIPDRPETEWQKSGYVKIVTE